MNYHQLGQILRELRSAAGLTRDSLAADLGITPNAITHYERGRRKIPLPTLERWAEVCGRSMHVVLAGPGVEPAAALPLEDQRLVDLVRHLDPADRRLVEQLALGLRPGRSPELREAVVCMVDLLAASAASADSVEGGLIGRG